MPPSTITLEELSDYFHMPEKMVAQKMGMCLTSLKKVCRAHGITRWPFRKLKSLERTMQKVNADSNLICVQMGKSGAEAARASKSTESSRAQSPVVQLNCDKGMLPPWSRQSAATPTTPKQPAFSPKAESAVRDSARSLPDSVFPSFTISGVNMLQLIISNWSSLWTIHHLNVHIVKPLSALTMAISEDGSKAYIDFVSSLAAVQAKKVCEEACDLLRSRQLAAEHAQVKKETKQSACHHHLEAETENDSAENMQAPSSNPRFMEVNVRTSQPMSSKSSSTGPQPENDDEECGSWMLPLMPGTGGPSSGARRDWTTLMSPPLSCGSQSGSGEPGSFNSSSHHSDEWMSPCLVSC